MVARLCVNSRLILLLCSTLAAACAGSASPAPAVSQAQTSSVEQELERRLKTISDGAQGAVGLSVVHIESGKTISINGQSQLPLYSVFKLPLAIAVLQDIEEDRVRLNQKIHVTPAEIVPGKLPDAAQEKVIADLARAAYDVYGNSLTNVRDAGLSMSVSLWFP